MSRKKKINTAGRVAGTAALGGLGVFGVLSALQAFPARKANKGLLDLINYIEKNNKTIKNSTKEMLKIHDLYGAEAQKLDNAGIFGSSIRGIAEKYPLSWLAKRVGAIVDKSTTKEARQAALKSFLNEIRTGKKSLTPEEWAHFSLDKKHYVGVAQDPARTLSSEILTNNAMGNFSDLRNEIKGVVDRDLFDKIINTPGTVQERFAGHEDLLKDVIKKRYTELFDPPGKKGAHNLRQYNQAAGAIIPAVATTAGLGAVGAGAGIYELNKESSEVDKLKKVLTEEMTQEPSSQIGAGATVGSIGTGLTGGLVLGSAGKYKKPKDSEIIGVGIGGSAKGKATKADEEAASAIVEALRKHPRVKDGSIKVVDLAKDKEFPRGSMSLVQVGDGRITTRGVSTNPEGLVAFLNKAQTGKKIIDNKDIPIAPNNAGSKKYISFGGRSSKPFHHALKDQLDAILPSPRNINISHTSVSPALSDKVISKLVGGKKTKAVAAKKKMVEALIDHVYDTRAMSEEILRGKKALAKNLFITSSILGVTGAAAVANRLMKNRKLNKKASEENLSMNPLQAILQQQGGMPERPGNPVLDGSAIAGPSEIEEGPADTRKLTISDKGMDGDEIKMSVESSKENDDRINFLLNAFTQKTQDNGASDEEAAAVEASSPVPAEVADMPAQGIPTI